MPDAPTAGAPAVAVAAAPDSAALSRPPPPEPWWRPAVDAVVARVPRSPRGVAAMALAAVIAVVVLVLSARPAGAPTGRVEDSLPRATPARSSSAAGSAPAPSDPTTDELVVHVAGAVNNPGVHSIKPGSRVVDAIAAAGGAAPDAEVDLLDLAAKVSDGQRIYVPRQGDDPSVIGGAAGADAGAGGGPVDLNSATADQLDALPGVGPSLAAAIIEYRQRHGPFTSVDQLLDVPGIGESKLASLRSKVTT